MQKFDTKSIDTIFLNVERIEFNDFMTIKNTNITEHLDYCHKQGFYIL